ncbi:hypothetical protein [uncultured Desulfovibrio sp.]|uniref:hypothetical protein n=1 Tax=uncultured Desulfovibrio sp. TaxID=167968 RepID=UPI002620393F|nr:hypothetical protein [uncultured Desulfovibrio sp.]
MAETIKLIKSLLDPQTDKEMPIDSAAVLDRTSGKRLNVILADTLALGGELEALKTALETFLSGEADGGAVDRLKELVAAIQANKDSIDALVADHLKKGDIINDLTSGGAEKVLSAEQGKALKALVDAVQAKAHSHENADLLAGLSTAVSGNLLYNGKELDGSGIEIVTSAEDPAPQTGLRLRIVVDDYTPAE